MQMTTVQIKKPKSDLSVWSRWQPSTGNNDFNWFSKQNKCSNMNWLPFISPKRADYKRLQDKTPDQTQFNWMVHFINNTERHVCARASEKGGKMRRRARTTAANHSHEWTNRFSTSIETTPTLSPGPSGYFSKWRVTPQPPFWKIPRRPWGRGWKQRKEFQQIKQNRAIFVWMKKNKGVKVRRKQ